MTAWSARELAGYFHCLDARTGKKYWEHNLEARFELAVLVMVRSIRDAGQFVVFSHGKEKKEPAVVELPVKYARDAGGGGRRVLCDHGLAVYAIGRKK